MSASLNKLREEVEALHRDEQLRLDGEKKEILERIEKQVRKKLMWFQNALFCFHIN